MKNRDYKHNKIMVISKIIFFLVAYICFFNFEGFTLDIQNNEVLSKIKRNTNLSEFIAQPSPRLKDPFLEVSKDSYEFSVVKVSRRNQSQNWEFHGTAFIVADSQVRSCLNHTHYLPFNYQYNPTTSSDKKSPLLYLVSNAHVLDRASTQWTAYEFGFNYVRTTPNALRKRNDFLKVGIRIPHSRFNLITTHPDDAPGNRVDLACLPLNPLLHKASLDVRLTGYKPAFTAVDMHSMDSSQIHGKNGTSIWMYGFPGGEFDRNSNVPLRVDGTCSTDPKNLRCDTSTLTGYTQPSLVDFKVNVTDIAGASGSPIFIDSHSHKPLLLGVNFAQNFQQIGYAIHASRLDEFLKDTTTTFITTPIFQSIINGVTPLTPQPATGIIPEADPVLTADNPQPLIVRLNNNIPLASALLEVSQELARGPSIVDFSNNDLLDNDASNILNSITSSNHLNNVIVLKISSNRLKDFSSFRSLLSQPNFRFLDITINYFSYPTIFADLNDNDAERSKIISALKGQDFELIQANGIQLSPEAHRQYYRQFDNY